jgi:hypothetical protein
MREADHCDVAEAKKGPGLRRGRSSDDYIEAKAFLNAIAPANDRGRVRTA